MTPKSAGEKEYHFRIPTCAQIAYGDIDSWLDDWQSLKLMLSMTSANGFKWVEESILWTLLSDITQNLKYNGCVYDGKEWSHP